MTRYGLTMLAGLVLYKPPMSEYYYTHVILPMSTTPSCNMAKNLKLRLVPAVHSDLTGFHQGLPL